MAHVFTACRALRARGGILWESTATTTPRLACVLDIDCRLWPKALTPALPGWLAQIVEVINERKKAITLRGFIDQIFDKALIETTFAELYAKLVAA